MTESTFKGRDNHTGRLTVMAGATTSDADDTVAKLVDDLHASLGELDLGLWGVPAEENGGSAVHATGSDAGADEEAQEVPWDDEDMEDVLWPEPIKTLSPKDAARGGPRTVRPTAKARTDVGAPPALDLYTTFNASLALSQMEPIDATAETARPSSRAVPAGRAKAGQAEGSLPLSPFASTTEALPLEGNAARQRPATPTRRGRTRGPTPSPVVATRGSTSFSPTRGKLATERDEGGFRWTLRLPPPEKIDIDKMLETWNSRIEDGVARPSTASGGNSAARLSVGQLRPAKSRRQQVATMLDSAVSGAAPNEQRGDFVAIRAPPQRHRPVTAPAQSMSGAVVFSTSRRVEAPHRPPTAGASTPSVDDTVGGEATASAAMISRRPQSPGSASTSSGEYGAGRVTSVQPIPPPNLQRGVASHDERVTSIGKDVSRVESKSPSSPLRVLRRDWGTRRTATDDMPALPSLLPSKHASQDRLSGSASSGRSTGETGAETKLSQRDLDRLAVFSGLFTANELTKATTANATAEAGTSPKKVRTELPHFTPTRTLRRERDENVAVTVDDAGSLAAVRPSRPAFRVDGTNDADAQAVGSTGSPAAGSPHSAGLAVDMSPAARAAQLLAAMDPLSVQRRHRSSPKRLSSMRPGARIHERIKRHLARGEVMPAKHSGKRRRRRRGARAAKADFNSSAGALLADGFL